jgi:flagellar basal-body rod protein FlgC
MYGSLDISTSGMIAQRTRLDVISANIANKGAILDADGNYNPFRRRMALLAPGNPGYIREPNIDTTTEQIDAMEAVRAYEANVAAAEALKSMLSQGLRLLA